MSVLRGLFVRKDSTRGTSPVEARVALAGLLTQNGDLGVTPGVLSGGAVTGKTAWAYTVGAGHFVTSRSATDGAVLLATDGATDTPSVSAAPATGSRWDLIWIRHRDVENADPDSNAILGVTSGTSSGTPSKPYGSVPAGALVLAEAQVSAGAANTADALVTITGVAPRVAARGGIIPVSSTTQRDLLTAAGSATNPVYTDLAGAIARSTGSGWTRIGGGRAPYMRLTQAANQTRTGGSFSQVAFGTTAEAEGAQPWAVANGAITVTESGLYEIQATISGVLSTFAVHIFRTNDNVVLGQSPTGSGASQTNQARALRRLSAGDIIVVRVNPSANMNVLQNAPTTPSDVVITKVSD